MRFSALIFSVFSLLAVLFTLTGCDEHSNGPAAGAVSNDSVRISDGWVRMPPTPGMMTAGYFTIYNSSQQPHELVAVSSPQFARVEMHESAMSEPAGGGMPMMTMNRLSSVVIPAGKVLEFKPGGNHLMLFDPVKPINPDERYDFTLTLRGEAGEQQLTVPFNTRSKDR